MASSQVSDQAIPAGRGKNQPEVLQVHQRRAVSTPLDVPALMQRLVELLDLIAPSAPTVVFLHDPASDRYQVRHAHGLVSTDKVDLGFSLESPVARWIGAQDQPLYPGKSQSMPPSPFDSLGMVLFLPLRGGWGLPEDRPRGWVALGPRPTGEPYGEGDLSLLIAAVDQAALAVENRLLRESIAELDQAKAEFIDFVAHELKQPMTAMQGYAKMLLMGIAGGLSDKQNQFIQVINANVGRMGKLVNDLLEISRLEAGRIKLEPQQFQPSELVDEALDALRAQIEARQHALEVLVPADLPALTGDRARLVQVLVSLLSNAILYTPDGGKISVRVSRADPLRVPAGHLLFSISDTGIGMSPEDISRLDKFFRADHDLVTSQPGTGLGLSIARHLVELHGGELMVESEPEQGSTFSFTVPITPSNAR